MESGRINIFWHRARAIVQVEQIVTIRVGVITNDSTLIDWCRTALATVCPGQYELCQWSRDQIEAADLYIWDAAEGNGLPALLVTMTAPMHPTTLVIGSRRELSSIRAELGCEKGVVFLFRPLQALALRTFFQSAIAGIEVQSETDVSRLQADRDQMFQYLLNATLKLQEYHRDRRTSMIRTVHELRGPLMAAQGYCELLLAGRLGEISSNHRGILERIRGSLIKLEQLTSVMLEDADHHLEVT